jgi:hypothetical protein
MSRTNGLRMKRMSSRIRTRWWTHPWNCSVGYNGDSTGYAKGKTSRPATMR